MRTRLRVAPVTAVTVATALLVGVVVGGWGWPRTAVVSGSRQPSAARAVLALTRDDPGAPAAVPAGFAAVMGYRPALVASDGRPELIRADGGCSSPWGDTRYGFGTACRQHDLGYDLLRYSAAEHQPLGPWARRAVDAHFRAALLARCAGLVRVAASPDRAGHGCRAAAAVYVAAVRFNSWRQGWGDPIVESSPVLLGPGVAGVLAGALGGALAGSTRVRGRVMAMARAVLARLALRERAGRLLVSSVVLALCLQPAAVPRPLWVQALVGGLVAAQAYLLATLACRITGRTGWQTAGRPHPVSGRLCLIGTGAALATSTVASAAAQLRLDGMVGAAARSPGSLLLGTPAAVTVGVAVVVFGLGAGTAVRWAGLATARQLRRPVGRRLATAVLVPALVLGVGATAAAASTAGPGTTRAGASMPADVGARGRRFLAGAAVTTGTGSGAGTRGVRAVRVYVGRDQGATPDGRARLAVRELRRAGGFRRSVLLIAVPTGSGWVNQDAVSALERSRHGDVATVAVQYAASPSWVSYLRGGEGVQATVRAVAEAVHTAVSKLPVRGRPRVLLYGESLGAWGGLRAYPDPDRLRHVADGALWVGVPAGSGPRPAPGGREGASTRVLTVVHRDDPVPAWRPSLLLRPDPAWHHTWMPLVSFWRETADVIAADGTPVGHGHRYGPELAGAWRTLTAGRAGGPGP